MLTDSPVFIEFCFLVDICPGWIASHTQKEHLFKVEKVSADFYHLLWLSKGKDSTLVAWHSLDFAVCMECTASFSRKYHSNDLACLVLPSSSWQARNTLQWAMPLTDDIFTLKTPFFTWIELTKQISMGTRTSVSMLQHNITANRELHIHIQPKSGDSHFIPKPCKQLPASNTQPANHFPSLPLMSLFPGAVNKPIF